MVRCQFYPSESLLQKIREEAKEKGISESAVIIERLEFSYGIISREDDTTMSFSELMAKIQAEVKDYVDTLKKNNDYESEFTLYKASKIFAGLEMADDNGRLISMKPRIGKTFRALVDNKTIKDITPCYSEKTGKQKREHNAALYTLIKGEIREDEEA